MTLNYAQYVNPRKDAKQIEQTQPIPGKQMIPNSAGGYVFEVEKWARLHRFLILGTDGGTYYVSEKALTLENAEVVKSCISENGIKTVDLIVKISEDGRAPKNDAALFALAMCAASENLQTRQYALRVAHRVARIGTHLFHFAEYVKAFRGWGRAFKNTVRRWYNKKSLDDLIYQVIKYQQRDGWSHRDLLRLAHPKTTEPARNELYKQLTKSDLYCNFSHPELRRFYAAKELGKTTDIQKAVDLIRYHDLPRECVNTTLLNSREILAALLGKMPLTALLRNLGKMSAIEFLKPLSAELSIVVERLTTRSYLHKYKIHPLAVLVALMTYSQGHGEKGNLSWTPLQQIVDALNKAFYVTFDSIVPTGKSLMLGIDVSGSMKGGTIAGMSGVTPNLAAAAMPLVTAATEKSSHIMGFAHEFRELRISPTMNLSKVSRNLYDSSFGATDCALPMLYALKHKLLVDGFIIYTDHETHCGAIHPSQALNHYRKEINPADKLISVGMASTGFTVADPKDSGMLDIVGFDVSTPTIISNFLRGD